MKKITNFCNKLERLCVVIVFFVFLFLTENMYSQVAQGDVLYIDNNTTMVLSPGVGTYSFGVSPATSSSSRSTGQYGRLVFDSGVQFSGANNHFFNGYVSTLSNASFIAPVGQSIYAPAKVVSSNLDGVDVAFYSANPTTIDTDLGVGIESLYSIGYWHILRSVGSTANAVISLSWSSSIASLIGSDLNAVTIVGFDGAEWVEIPSLFDSNSFSGATSSSPTLFASTITQGSVTSTSSVDLSAFQFFTIAKKETCAPIVDDNGITTIWNGTTWSNGVPTEAHIVELSANFSGSLVANSLNLNTFNVTLGDNQVLEVVKSISGTGKVILSSPSASLIQRDDSATAPQIELLKNTRNLARNNYTYFSSPVQDNVFNQLQTAFLTTPSNNNRLYNHFKWTAGNDVLFNTPYFSAWTALNNMNFPSTGNGWISAIRPLAPFTNDGVLGVISMNFIGQANNGVINTTVAKSTNIDPDHGSNYNLLGNPYPSAISADKFIESNPNIDGVIYIWEAKTQPATTGTGYYDQSDYITYTKAGFTVPSIGSNTFNGSIASGQGFMVRAENSGFAVFNNCMRLSGATDNVNFYRNSFSLASTTDNNSSDSFKLNMIANNDFFSQVLIYYKDGLTLGYDRMYDALRNSTSGVQLYSYSGDTNSLRRLAINARPSFTTQDVVPVGIVNSSNQTLNYSISVTDRVGVFNNNVDIFIYDKILNVFHNLNSPYLFSSADSNLSNRFEIVYDNETLSNPDFNLLSLNAYIHNSRLVVTSNSSFDKVYVHDVSGRLINVYSDLSTNRFETDFMYSKGVYLLNVYSAETGKTTNFKLINK